MSPNSFRGSIWDKLISQYQVTSSRLRLRHLTLNLWSICYKVVFPKKRLNIRKDGDDENWLIFDQRTIVQQKKLRQKYEHETKQRHSTWHFSVTFKYKLCQISSLLCLKELNRNQCCWLTNFDFFWTTFLSDMLNFFRLKWLKLHIEAFFTYLALKQIVIKLFLHSSNQKQDNKGGG